MPHQSDFLVTGICRSGTALVVRLINDHIATAVCTNELVGSVDELDDYFARTRRAIVSGEPIANRYARNGQLTTNSWRNGATVEMRKVQKSVNGQLALGTKVLVGFIDRLPDVLRRGYRIVLVVRDPVYTIGSWTDPATAGQTVGRITDADLHPWWEQHPDELRVLQSHDAISRRAEYWQHLATKIADALDADADVMLLRYEDLVADPFSQLGRLARFISRAAPAQFELDLESKNIDQRYPRIDEIQQAVNRLCPARIRLGYC